jgi:ParB-like chromosome segregation protein Spo0J
MHGEVTREAAGPKRLTMTKSQVELRSLTGLTPHPLQYSLFPPLSDIELQALADDIEVNGLRHPVEILPDGTIVCGHQRVAAAKLLNWEEIDCIVRQDLVDAGDAAVERHLIDDNLNRRQLSDLDVVRLYRRLKESKRGKRTANGTGDWRDALAQRFNVSGRTLDRWEQVLDAEPQLIAAIHRRELTLTQAVRIASLPKKEQKRICFGLRDGKKLRELITRTGCSAGAKADPSNDSFAVLSRRLIQFENQLASEGLSEARLEAGHVLLAETRQALLHLLDQLDEAVRRQADGCGEFLPVPSSRVRQAAD